MGNDIIFFGLLVVFIVILLKKESVSYFIFDTIGVNISSKTVMNIAIVAIILVMSYGILFDDTKQKYSGISSNYNQMRANTPDKEGKEESHRWFDIDFDAIFPWR